VRVCVLIECVLKNRDYKILNAFRQANDNRIVRRKCSRIVVAISVAALAGARDVLKAIRSA